MALKAGIVSRVLAAGDQNGAEDQPVIDVDDDTLGNETPGSEEKEEEREEEEDKE